MESLIILTLQILIFLAVIGVCVWAVRQLAPSMGVPQPLVVAAVVIIVLVGLLIMIRHVAVL